MKNNVLIVDDDELFSSSLSTFITKSGGNAKVCSNAKDALDLIDKETFKLVLIDCLLPQVSGVELAKKIRKTFSSKMLQIVMMSGVFNDKITMKEIINDTQAKDFLKKPFQPNYILNYLDSDTTSEIENPTLNQTFTFYDNILKNNENIQDYLALINEISGYDLLFIISGFVDIKFNGLINLVDKSNSQKTKIEFKEGAIVKVDSLDSQSFIGRLLLSRGYVLIEDLEGVLRIPSSKKLATRLLEENLISPHSFEEVILDQISIRISKLIGEQNYFVSFDYTVPEFKENAIEPQYLNKYFYEWIKSRIPEEWIQNEFVKWYDFVIENNKNIRKDLNLLSHQEDLSNQISTDVDRINSFSNLLKLYEDKEKSVNHILLFLLGRGFLKFTQRLAVVSDEERFVRLQKIYYRMLKMNKLEIFEMMGGKKIFNEQDIKILKIEFEKKYLITSNPKKISGFEEMINEVKKKINETVELFLDSQKLSEYEHSIESQKATDKLKYQEILTKVRQQLSYNQFAKALETLIEVPDNLMLDNKMFYYIWASIGNIESKANKHKELTELEEKFENISSDQKLSSLGNFIKALILKSKGDIINAKKHIETSLALDKNFIEGRRELNWIQSVIDKNSIKENSSHLSFRNVVGSIIKSGMR